MRSRSSAGLAVAIGTLAALVGIGGCQGGDSGAGKPRTGDTSTMSGTVPKASAVTVTYYYLPG